MKTLKVFVLFVFLSSSIFSQNVIYGNNVKVENGWELVSLFASSMDSTMTKSSLVKRDNKSSQVFSSYAGVVPGWNVMQATWTKIYPNLELPDSISVDCKFLIGKNVDRIRFTITVQDSDQKQWETVAGEFIPDSNTWKKIFFDMKDIKDFGVNSIFRIMFYINFYTTDSIVGANLELDNLLSIKAGKFRLIDGFGDSTFTSGITGVGVVKQNLPQGFNLSQNFPNPFNPSTIIKYTIPDNGYVSLTVYNSLGQEVRNLISEMKQQGDHEVIFNASGLPSGMYFYKLQTATNVETKKMVLMK